jgi:Zn-finger nucleic acid-binding protein
MNIEALNCPNCGAGVASDSTQCRFCSSRLKTMACAKCLGLMFIGSEHCSHCGAKASAAEIWPPEKPGRCPRCLTSLDNLKVGEILLRECGKCGGLWSAVETFESICADSERQSAVLSFTADKTRIPISPARINYVPCPDCGQLMNRSNFARSSGVIIDLCKQHGVWFDAEELPKIIAFIRQGGMERARQREKLEIKEERDRLRDEQLRNAVRDNRFETTRKRDDNESPLGGLIGFLFDI